MKEVSRATAAVACLPSKDELSTAYFQLRSQIERRPVKSGSLYTIGRFADGPAMRRAYEQLTNLELEFRDTGMVYSCPSGLHDDLGISCAMLAWAARHPHLEHWMRNLPAGRRPRIKRDTSNWGLGWT